MNLWIKNTSGQPSASLTFCTIGFAVVTLWLLASIFAKIGHFEIRPFDGSQAMMFELPLLSLYFGRRYTDGKFTLDQTTPPTSEPTPPSTTTSGS